MLETDITLCVSYNHIKKPKIAESQYMTFFRAFEAHCQIAHQKGRVPYFFTSSMCETVRGGGAGLRVRKEFYNPVEAISLKILLIVGLLCM